MLLENQHHQSHSQARAQSRAGSARPRAVDGQTREPEDYASSSMLKRWHYGLRALRALRALPKHQRSFTKAHTYADERIQGP